MRSPGHIAALLLGAVTILVTPACATAQMHSEEQLNGIAQGCGLSFGEIMQDDSEKRLLFLMRSDPSAGQRVCVNQWARRNHLRLVVIHLDTEPAS